MFISNLRLTNFKRFTDLTIDLSGQAPPKLVLLIGANGSGKSCVFDAFEWANSDRRVDHYRPLDEDIYYAKIRRVPIEVDALFADGKRLHIVDGKIFHQRADQIFYGRSSLRQLPQLTRTGTGSAVDIAKDTDRPLRYIDRDVRFENDIDILSARLIEEIFGGANFVSSELRERYIGPINASLGRIFGSDPATAISLLMLIPPTREKVADIRFRKGASDIHYNLLSSGEKEILNVLLDLFVRREFFPNAVYFIDELDLHLNAALQSTLLKEIVEHWIPAGCQLWTASHSLGFIEYAQSSPEAAIVDFDQFDFDAPMTLYPTPKSNLDVIEIAVPRASLAKIFRGRLITFCENKNDELYNSIGIANRVFIGMKDKNVVYYSAKDQPQYYGLMDRDYMTDGEIALLVEKVPNLRVLRYYCFENYLYHPENVKEAYPPFDSDAYVRHLREQKNGLQLAVIVKLQGIRSSYKVLTQEGILDLEDKGKHAGTEEIATRLGSDKFEEFYPFLDMKAFPKSFLAQFNLSKERLVQTAWFKAQIEAVLI